MRKRPFSPWLPWVLFLTLPLLSLLLWGYMLADDAYLSLRLAQTIGQIEAFAAQLRLTALGYTPLSPAAWLALAGPVQVDWLVGWLTAVLAALGWGITAVFWHQLLRYWRLPLVDWLAPLLLLASPLVVWTAGSFVSWFLALAWLAILLTAQQKWRAQTLALLCLPLVSVSITAVALVVLLVMWRMVVIRSQKSQNRAAWLAPGALGLVCVLVLVGIGWQISRAPWQASFPFADWLSWSRRWRVADEFFWLLILLAVAAVAGKRRAWPVALWLPFALLDVNYVGQSALAAGLLFLAGVGLYVVGRWVSQRQWLELAPETIFRGTVGLLCLPLLWLLLASLFAQPADSVSAAAVGAWLRENSEADAVVLGDPAVGYFAERAVLAWNGRSQQQNWADFIRQTEKVSPDYIVTNNGLFWDGLVHLPWWQDRYQQAQVIGTQHVWQYSPQPALAADVVPLSVVLENGVRLVGYQQAPLTIMPGEAVNVSLHFQVDEPIAAGFGTVVWLPSPLDGANQALRDLLTPRAVPSNWWLPGQIVTEQFVLTTTEQIPMGGYRPTVAFRTQDSFERMPLYQGGDNNPLDRVPLAYVAVPWTGTISDTAQPFPARFGEEFQLLAADLPEAQARPGTELTLQLYWEALDSHRPQTDYTIFVHLLNEAGELVANADGPPQGGQYATGAWTPGTVVPDTHRLLLPPDLPPGRYHIYIGAYVPETGARLPVFADGGEALPGASLPLMAFMVE